MSSIQMLSLRSPHSASARALRSVALPALLFLALLLIGLAAPARAQDANPVTFGLSGGASFPTGRLADGAKTGYSVGGHLYVLPSSLGSLHFRGDVSFDRWDVAGVDAGVDEDARALGFVMNAVYEFPMADEGRFRPYLIGGVGAYRQKVTATFGSLSANREETNVGVQVGGGVRFAFSGFSTFLEAKYLTAYSTESWNWVPVTFGVRF